MSSFWEKYDTPGGRKKGDNMDPKANPIEQFKHSQNVIGKPVRHLYTSSICLYCVLREKILGGYKCRAIKKHDEVTYQDILSIPGMTLYGLDGCPLRKGPALITMKPLDNKVKP